MSSGGTGDKGASLRRVGACWSRKEAIAISYGVADASLAMHKTFVLSKFKKKTPHFSRKYAKQPVFSEIVKKLPVLRRFVPMCTSCEIDAG
jgi:hypothetical protein